MNVVCSLTQAETSNRRTATTAEELVDFIEEAIDTCGDDLLMTRIVIQAQISDYVAAQLCKGEENGVTATDSTDRLDAT